MYRWSKLTTIMPERGQNMLTKLNTIETILAQGPRGPILSEPKLGSSPRANRPAASSVGALNGKLTEVSAKYLKASSQHFARRAKFTELNRTPSPRVHPDSKSGSRRAEDLTATAARVTSDVTVQIRTQKSYFLHQPITYILIRPISIHLHTISE